jgi:hypothetical protein
VSKSEMGYTPPQHARRFLIARVLALERRMLGTPATKLAGAAAYAVIWTFTIWELLARPS